MMTIQELIDELDKIEDKEQIIIKYTDDGYVLEIAASVFNTPKSPDFIIGSKWVAKCSITARTMGTSYITAYEGEVLELTSIWDTHILEFNHQYVLEKGEARLLLSPLERLG